MPKGSGKQVTSQGTNQGVSRVVSSQARVCVYFAFNCRDPTTPTTVMEATATPTRVGRATTTRATVTGSTAGQSVLLCSAGLVLMIVLVDPKALSLLVGPRTPPTTTTTREPAPPPTREGRSDAQPSEENCVPSIVIMIQCSFHILTF